MLTVRRHWTMEIPPEWNALLRQESPISSVTPWLALRWFPFQHQTDAGLVDAGRWLLYECVHESLVPSNQSEIIAMLAGPPPSWIATHPENYETHSAAERRAAVRLSFADNYQCEMYRKHRVWARVLWIIQGDHGGHAVHYEPAEQQLLRLKGLPQDPPAVGALPYAPFDMRVVRQMRSRNRLIAFGNSLDALRKSGDPRVIEAEWKAEQKNYRAEYIKYLDAQNAAAVEFLTDWSSTKDCRGSIPAMSTAQLNANAMTRDMYIETGDLPYVPA